MKNKYIVAAIGEWNNELFEKKSKQFNGEWYFASNPEELSELLDSITPKYIFFPHWRWVVPKSILDKFMCVCFHMTDVPYGRGGSPLQNLIVLGHKETVLTALQMEEGLDSGPIYLKKKLSLEGTAFQIYKRTSLLAWSMIKEIVENEIQTTPQSGDVVLFKRRKPEDSEIPNDLEFDQIYDYIRMLDAPGYPKAFLSSNGYRIEFDQAGLHDEFVTARVRIKKEDI